VWGCQGEGVQKRSRHVLRRWSPFLLLLGWPKRRRGIGRSFEGWSAIMGFPLSLHPATLWLSRSGSGVSDLPGDSRSGAIFSCHLALSSSCCITPPLSLVATHPPFWLFISVIYSSVTFPNVPKFFRRQFPDASATFVDLRFLLVVFSDLYVSM